MKKPSLDYLFVFSFLALTAVGTLMIFSASPTMALKLGDSYYFLKRHIFFLLMGFGAFYYALNLDLNKLKKFANLIFMISVLLLLVVFIPGIGQEVSGASRWINFGFFSFQPSELIKFAMILFLANMLAKPGFKLLPILAAIGLVCGIIILQPDLGTAICIASTSFVLLFAAGAEMLHLGILAGLGIVGVLIISIKSAYRLNRLLAFLDPWKDPQGISFQIIQSLLAVGSGGFTGLGLGASRQKFFYLPQQFTDFIFAILCEELGFIGGVGVVLLFLIFAARGIKIALSTDDKFKSLLVLGIISWITVQALTNMMVVVGLLPTTGIPLPLISYGGTATTVILFSIGIVMNVSIGQRAKKS